MLRLQLVSCLISDSIRKLGIFVLAASWLPIWSPAADAFDVINITNNSTDDYYPAISGSNVVWLGNDGSGDEVYLWNGATTTQITDNSINEWYPDVSGSNVAWEGSDGDPEIYLWSGGTTTQLTNNTSLDYRPAISGSNVVWLGHFGVSYEIFLWDGATTTRITNNSTFDGAPAVSGPNVVWKGCEGGTGSGCDGGDYEIYLWDGVSITQITHNSTSDVDPDISGSSVVWMRCDGGAGVDCPGGDWEIYHWNGVSITQITDNSSDDWRPAISGSNVVWFGHDGNDSEIYLWDGATTTQVTDNSASDQYPDISGSKIVWMGWEEEDSEIYMATISETGPDPDRLEIVLLKDWFTLFYEYGIFFDANKVGATTCTLQTPSYPEGFACPFGLEERDLSGLIFSGMGCSQLEAEIETAGDDWTLTWDEGLPTETEVQIDFGSIDCASDWPADFPWIIYPPDGETGVSPGASIDWEWAESPVLYEVRAVLVGLNSDVRSAGELPHPPPPTSWTPDSPLTPGDWTGVVMNATEIRDVPEGLTFTGDPWDLDNSTWLAANSMDLSDFTVALPLPSLSPEGAALLGGLVFAIALGGLAVQRRRRAG